MSAGRAALVGGGVIGGGWAARFLLMGWDVALHDPDPDAARKVEAVVAAGRRALPMLYDVALPSEGRLTIAASAAEAVEGADWVQESVPERLELKRAVLDEILAHAPVAAPVASSTSGFRPSELDLGRGRVLVAHPFNPVYLLPLVEVVAPHGMGEARVAGARAVLDTLGMVPLRLRHEIDAHVADRLMEAVWRESLWLVKDGIATTEQIDDAIRLGFGLRWAQMGLFETWRLAGGEAGMRHFLRQFGPALAWPWSRLTDVPDLDDALVETIAAQSDAQSGHVPLADLARRRDDALVAVLRALRQQGVAAGAHLTRHEAGLARLPEPAEGRPLRTVARTVPVDWTDYNGHMNEGRYGQIFSDAAEPVLDLVGAGPAEIDAGGSFFTVETRISYRAETRAGASVTVDSLVREAEGKKLRLRHEMRGADGALLATCDQLLIHVSLQTRRAAPPAPAVAARMAALAAAHAGLAP